MKLVIAEKPSVAMALAAVLGADEKKDGYLEGGGYLVSWCVGHLLELAQPEAYGEQYRSQKAVYDAELVQAKNVHAAITAQTKQIQSDYEARLKQREIVQEVGSTDVLTQSLIDRLINRVYVFPGDRIEIEYVTQDFLGTEKSGKEA